MLHDGVPRAEAPHELREGKRGVRSRTSGECREFESESQQVASQRFTDLGTELKGGFGKKNVRVETLGPLRLARPASVRLMG